MRLSNLNTASLYKFTFVELLNRYHHTLGKDSLIGLPVDVIEVLDKSIESGSVPGVDAPNQEFDVAQSLRMWLTRHTENSYAYDMESIDVEMNEGGFENESVAIVTGDFIGATKYLLESLVGEYYALYKNHVQLTHQYRLSHVDMRTEDSWALYLGAMQTVSEMHEVLVYMEKELVKLFPIEQTVLL